MRPIHSSKSREAFGVVVTFTADNYLKPCFSLICRSSSSQLMLGPSSREPIPSSMTCSSSFVHDSSESSSSRSCFFSSLVSFGSSSSILSKLIRFNRILSATETRALFFALCRSAPVHCRLRRSARQHHRNYFNWGRVPAASPSPDQRTRSEALVVVKDGDRGSPLTHGKPPLAQHWGWRYQSAPKLAWATVC
jgi:hypothetical protein